MKAHVAQFVEPPSALSQNVKYYLNGPWDTHSVELNQDWLKHNWNQIKSSNFVLQSKMCQGFRKAKLMIFGSLKWLLFFRVS